MRILTAVAVALAATLPAASAAAQTAAPPELRILAVSGEPAPDTEPGTVFGTFTSAVGAFTEFEPPNMDRQGNVAFVSTLEGPAVVPALEADSNAMAIYEIVDHVAIEKLARQQDPIPGEPGAVFTDFGNTFAAIFAYIDGFDGRVSFQSTSGIFAETLAGELQRYVTDPPFDGVPPGVTVEFEPLGGPPPAQIVLGEVEPDGTVLTRLFSPGVATDKSTWMVRLHPDGPPQVIFGDGYPAPGIPGATVGRIGNPCTVAPAATSFNFGRGTNDFVISTTLVGPGLGCLNDEALYHFVDDVPQLVLREGDPAPGFADPAPTVGSINGFETFSTAGFLLHANANGRIAFATQARGGLVPGEIDVLYTDRSGALEPVVVADFLCASGEKAGDQVPGKPAGFMFSSIQFGDFNDAGRVVFRAEVGDSTLPDILACESLVDGLFWDATGELTTLAVEGDPVGLFGPDVVHAFVDIPRFAGAHTAFCAVRVEGPGIDASNDRALLAWDLDGRARALLREGDLLDVQGTPRVLDDFVLGRGTSALGETAVRLLFADGGEALAALRVVEGDLLVDDTELSSQVAEEVGFDLLAGSAHAGRTYALLASLSGTTPGISFPLGATLPLNFDGFMNFTINNLNTQVFDGFMGQLDAIGRAQATFRTLSPLGPAAVGLGVDFAYVLLQPIDVASQAVRVEFID